MPALKRSASPMSLVVLYELINLAVGAKLFPNIATGSLTKTQDDPRLQLSNYGLVERPTVIGKLYVLGLD